MYEITVSIAGCFVKIKAVYAHTLLSFKPYQVEERPDFVVQSSMMDICNERRLAAELNQKYILSDTMVESTVLLRKVADRMLDHNTLLIHGAVVAVDNNAYMFTANSGTGKTTHIYKWIENVPGAYVVNGDKPLVIVDDHPRVCGSPWCGKEKLGCNKIIPLKAIVFMERSEDNEIHEITPSEAFLPLLGQTHRPEDAAKMRKTLDLLQELSGTTLFYKFRCNNFKDDCFDIAYGALVGEK